MFQWLKSCLGLRSPAVPEPTILEPVRPVEDEEAVSDAPPPPSAVRDETMCAFLTELVSEAGKVDLQDLPADDRVFVSGVLKRIREEKLEVPVLPQAALQISELLADPNSDARAFARILEGDPALSVDVLRIANSAYYGFTQKTESVRDAVVRIGLAQLRGLIIITHLQGKVLQGGAFRKEAEWLVELSMALAQVSQALSRELGIGRDEAFTRGVLSHVEHFIIMGSVGEVARVHKKRIQPTRTGLLGACHLCGERVRRLAGRKWDLESMMSWEGEAAEIADRYRQLREAVVAAWSGESALPAVDGVDASRLSTVVAQLERNAAESPAQA